MNCFSFSNFDMAPRSRSGTTCLSHLVLWTQTQTPEFSRVGSNKGGSVPVHSRRLGEICYLVRYRVGAGGGSQAEMCEPLTRKFVQPWTDSLEMGYSHQASCSPVLPQGTESLTRWLMSYKEAAPAHPFPRSRVKQDWGRPWLVPVTVPAEAVGSNRVVVSPLLLLTEPASSRGSVRGHSQGQMGHLFPRCKSVFSSCSRNS